MSSMKRKDGPGEEHGSLRLWVTSAVALLTLFMVALGQWDVALALFIGLLVGNGLGVLIFGR